MPRIRTHYDNLKVSRDAPIEVIQAAYRSLARKHHPDRNASTAEGEAIMKIINASYEVLSDPVKRAEHDRWISSQLGNQGAHDQTDGGFGSSGTTVRPAEKPPHPSDDSERILRVLVNAIIAVSYFAAALWMLRYPGLRIVGVIMLIVGLIVLNRRAR